ncbi:uncharacterized protein [Physcomitrium patens]|uniref:uncharacterized protein isoform X1 n=1 Tax=Physcomitrium patens TaxID=3218 RepID=UPI003CCD0B9B
MRTVVWGSVSGKVRSLVSPTLLSGEGERLWSTDCTCEVLWSRRLNPIESCNCSMSGTPALPFFTSWPEGIRLVQIVEYRCLQQAAVRLEVEHFHVCWSKSGD